jgi:hypothetical protein
MDKFWVVMQDKSQMQAHFRHSNLESARQEAKRLCQENNREFFVFECLGVMKPTAPPVEWDEATEFEFPF